MTLTCTGRGVGPGFRPRSGVRTVRHLPACAQGGRRGPYAAVRPFADRAHCCGLDAPLLQRRRRRPRWDVPSPKGGDVVEFLAPIDDAKTFHIDGPDLVISQASTGSILRLSKTGGNPTTLFDSYHAMDLALGGGFAYFPHHSVTGPPPYRNLVALSDAVLWGHGWCHRTAAPPHASPPTITGLPSQSLTSPRFFSATTTARSPRSFAERSAHRLCPPHAVSPSRRRTLRA